MLWLHAKPVQDSVVLSHSWLFRWQCLPWARHPANMYLTTFRYCSASECIAYHAYQLGVRRQSPNHSPVVCMNQINLNLPNGTGHWSTLEASCSSTACQMNNFTFGGPPGCLAKAALPEARYPLFMGLKAIMNTTTIRAAMHPAGSHTSDAPVYFRSRGLKF